MIDILQNWSSPLSTISVESTASDWTVVPVSHACTSSSFCLLGQRFGFQMGHLWIGKALL